MSDKQVVVEKAIDHALSGEGAHVEAKKALQGLDWELAARRPPGAPHSIFQLLSHVVYWQDWVARWLNGDDPPLPEHAPESWPGEEAPPSRDVWERLRERFETGVDELRRQSRDPDLFGSERTKSRLEMLHTIASHNSYHLGQIVLLRRMLGDWPPPSGGLTW